MSEHDVGHIVAYDYTPIVKHRGKQFTVGDLSLAKFGGVDLSAAWVALIPAIGVAAAVVVLLMFTPFTAMLAAIPAFLTWLVLYVWFSRETLDTLAPIDRIMLTVTSKRTQPTILNGATSGRQRRTGKRAAVSSLVGSRHPGEDRTPDRLHWVVIVKRPTDSDRLKVGAPLTGRDQYRPRPRASAPLIHDDRDQFDDWYAYLETQNPYGTATGPQQ